MKKIGFKFRNKKYFLEVKVCSFFIRIIGLMFSRRQNARALIFEFNKDVKIGIHSLFVFYDFVAVWLDKENKVLEFQRVKPFCFFIIPEKKFRKLIEIPVNRRYKEILKIFNEDRKI